MVIAANLLSAQVVALETQLAEARRTLEEQRPVSEPLTVGSYVRVVRCSDRKYCDRIGQIVQLPEQNHSLNRFKVQLSGDKMRVICYLEQMEGFKFSCHLRIPLFP